MLQILLSKVGDLQTCNFIKTTLQHRCFLVKFAKFLITPIFGFLFLESIERDQQCEMGYVLPQCLLWPLSRSDLAILFWKIMVARIKILRYKYLILSQSNHASAMHISALSCIVKKMVNILYVCISTFHTQYPLYFPSNWENRCG